MKKIIIAIFLMAFSINAYSQNSKNHQYYTLGWSVAKLIGNSDSYSQEISPSGFTFSGQFYTTEQFAVGFNVTWNNYYDLMDRQSYKLETGTYVTAEQYNYMTSVPIQMGGFWNFMPDEILQPYVGLSIGVNYSTESVYISDRQFYDDQYGFHVSPELGAFIKFGKYANYGANIAVSYQYNTNSFEFATTGKHNGIQGVTATIGLSYMY